MATHDGRPFGPEVEDMGPAKLPNGLIMTGHFVTMEPLASSHIDDLFAALGGSECAHIWDYMWDVGNTRICFNSCPWSWPTLTFHSVSKSIGPVH